MPKNTRKMKNSFYLGFLADFVSYSIKSSFQQKADFAHKIGFRSNKGGYCSAGQVQKSDISILSHGA